MSEENSTTQTPEEAQAKNPSTAATDYNVPYDRFAEVNQAKKDGL